MLTHYRRFRLVHAVASPKIAKNVLFEVDPDLFGLGRLGSLAGFLEPIDCAAYWYFFLKSVFRFPQVLCLLNESPSVVYIHGEQVRSCLTYSFRSPPRAMLVLYPGQATRIATKYLVCQKHGWTITEDKGDLSVLEPCDPAFEPRHDIIDIDFDVEWAVQGEVEALLEEHKYRRSSTGVAILYKGKRLNVNAENFQAFKKHLEHYHGIHSMRRIMEDLRSHAIGTNYIDLTWVDPSY